jgi:hypothetical protein
MTSTESFCDGHGAQVALHFHRAIEDFHSLHALVQIHSELRAALGGERAKRRRHLQGLPEAGRERVKCGVTLAKIHVIDLAAIGASSNSVKSSNARSPNRMVPPFSNCISASCFPPWRA